MRVLVKCVPMMPDQPNKPLIGITTGTSPQWQEGGDFFESYAAPIRRAGGECIPLSKCSSSRVDECNGVLLSGGWDVHPDYYARLPGDEDLSAEDVMKRYGLECEPERDEYEVPCAKRALELGLPVLAICRGIQLLNIVLAGKLIPDIEKCVPNALQHRSSGTGVSASHYVYLDRDSLVGTAYGQSKIVVNTRHHQGLLPEMIPKGFKVTAMSPDGVVEAMESKDSAFIVGVQWHPERKLDSFIHDISAPLFEAFVEACRLNVQRRNST